MMPLPPIPAAYRTLGPDDVTIAESGEPLHPLTTAGRLIVQPAYAAMGFDSATETLQARAGVVRRLLWGAARLPDGYTLVIWDALRSLATQAEIAERFRRGFPAAEPFDLSVYVAPVPATREEFEGAPPAHSTGGAVDLTLGDRDGVPLDLGADFDEFSQRASLAFFEHLAEPTLADCLRRDRRRLLYWTMRQAGFAPYPAEFWHFERGTRRAAAFLGRQTAPYGPMVKWEDRREIACA